MAVSITLASPGYFDIKALAESTCATLELLEPWCRPQNSHAAGPRKDIVVQALEYTKAINLSITAAQAGFTVAVDIISFADIIPTSTVPERLEYLKGLSEMANKARANTEETLETFKDVRQKVYSLTEKAKEQMMDPRILSSNGYNTLRRSLEPSAAELRAHVAVLEKFADHISKFVEWWDWMRIEPSAQQTQNDQTLTYYHASLTDQSVILKWREFKAQCVAYTDMIGRMQDAYPHLFRESMNGLEPQQQQAVASPVGAVAVTIPTREAAVMPTNATTPARATTPTLVPKSPIVPKIVPTRQIAPTPPRAVMLADAPSPTRTGAAGAAGGPMEATPSGGRRPLSPMSLSSIGAAQKIGCVCVIM